MDKINKKIFGNVEDLIKKRLYSLSHPDMLLNVRKSSEKNLSQ